MTLDWNMWVRSVWLSLLLLGSAKRTKVHMCVCVCVEWSRICTSYILLWAREWNYKCHAITLSCSCAPHGSLRVVEDWLHSFFTSASEGYKRSESRSGRCTRRDVPLYPLHRRLVVKWQVWIVWRSEISFSSAENRRTVPRLSKPVDEFGFHER